MQCIDVMLFSFSNVFSLVTLSNFELILSSNFIFILAFFFGFDKVFLFWKELLKKYATVCLSDKIPIEKMNRGHIYYLSFYSFYVRNLVRRQKNSKGIGFFCLEFFKNSSGAFFWFEHTVFSYCKILTFQRLWQKLTWNSKR